MKKVLLFIMGLACAGAMTAQTKQGVNAVKMHNDAQLSQQSASYIQTPPSTVQTISGYYQQGFEPVTFPPTGCQVVNVAGPTYTWARSTAQAHLSTASAFMRYDATTGGGEDWLIMPRYLVTATTDSVTFWMRLAFSGYPPDSLSIKVSSTDSLTSSFTTTLLKLQEGTNYPGNTTTWYRYAVSLSAFNGQQVYIAFKHYDNDGDGLYVDDVTMGTPPAAEVGTTAIITPAGTLSSGSVVPQGTFKNFGTASQTFNVTTIVTPGGYTSTMPVTALAPSASATVSFAPWTATPGTYTLKMFTQLPGDANLLNDTLTSIITVLPSFTQYGWNIMSPLPAGRWATAPVFAKPCIASADTGYVYLISGGDASFANSTLNTRYNPQTGAYVNLAPIPQSRTQVTPLHVNGKIYVIGGYGGSFSPVTTNSIYDIATNAWTTGAVIPVAVGDYAAGVYKDSLIYIIGGYNGSADVNLVQIYNTYTDTWTSGTPKTGTTVAGCRMGISGNNIVLVGGYSQSLAATQSTAYLGVINAATPTTIAWSSLPNYPGGTTGREGGGVSLEDNGLVYFCAGDPDGAGTQVLNTIYAYNTVLGQWESGPNMPVGISNISGIAGAVYNDSLFLVTIGGYDGTSVVTQNSWLNIGPAAPLPAAQNDTTICAGNSIQLNASNAITYSWSPAGSLDNASIANPTSFAVVTTNYTVTMTRSYGCPVIDSVTLTVNPLPAVAANSTASAVCDGSPVTLSGSGATSYSWTGSVSNNVAFIPTSTDTYTVTGTDANGCSNTDMITVTVNPLPAVAANSTASAVCDGSPVTLSGSGATSYSWTGSVTDNVAFTPTVTDTYTVTGTDANGCSDTDMITVTVNPLPTITANATSTSVCNGGSVTLTGGGAVSYTWTGGVTDNVPFNAAFTDTYTVTGTDANGCQDTASVLINVLHLPAVVANATSTAVCNGSPVTLTGSGASTYTWTGSVTDGVAFTPAATGSYTVTGTDSSGCQNTDSILVTVNPLPGVTASSSSMTMCIDDASATLTGTPAGGTWSGAGVSGSTFDPSVAGLGSQTATYIYTDTNGCNGNAAVTITVNACTGVAENAFENNVALFPNPNNGSFSISVNKDSELLNIEVLDLQGRIIYAASEKNIQPGFVKYVQLENAANGIYMVRLTGNGTQQIIKISVQH